MAWSLDARIPLRLLTPLQLDAALQSAPATALLVEGTPPTGLTAPAVIQLGFQPGDGRHRPDCNCCAGRGLVAEALDRMFQARIRGQCAWFEQVIGVVESDAAKAEVLDALALDPLAKARFRPA